jgi:hypothetical protein
MAAHKFAAIRRTPPGFERESAILFQPRRTTAFYGDVIGAEDPESQRVCGMNDLLRVNASV